ncbi:MAG: asparagine synthase (glutamine-hydrolyzing) [Bacilli bacterium]|nr:asparagine synthase (glutamine-hydrolyzing) [Bacilli bacterium]
MCAILGWISQNDLNKEKDKFKRMLEFMSMRGKDNTDYYLKNNIMLGHKRLAIIDLENGNQPMTYNDYTIVYNGELYNTKQLKEELLDKGYSFFTNSDTEVVLKGYICYKEKIMNKLEGIYAFGIYNDKDKSLFLGRDRLGIKPLYYLNKNKNFIFSSMIKPILESKIIKPILTKKEIGELLALGPSKKIGSGIFKNIKELRAAHYLIYKKGKIKIKRYWNVKDKKNNDTFEEASNKVKNILTDAIKDQMVSDTPIATLLSGGIDSSIITAIVADTLKKENKILTTYSIDYEDNNKYFKKNSFTVSLDEYFINLMSKKYHTNHKYKIISQKELAKYLEKSLTARDYPGMADIDSSLLWFSEQISKDYKVILSGECADEIFGGYPWFYRSELNERKNFPWINNLDYRQKLLNKNLKINLKKICKKEYKKTIKELPRHDRKNKYKKLFYINMTHFMTTLLDRKDRMTMGATLEARVPFSNTKLVEYLWNLPFEYKYKSNIEKYLLRDAFKDILPNEVLNRKKNPYPKTHNPAYLKLVTNLLKKRLKNKDSYLYKIFNIKEIENLLNSKDDDILPWFGQLMTKPQLIAYLYQFDLWIEKYNIEIKI